ncbi:hypothetical protein AtDm6_3342 [Acetobacter tropicalis]|uniref:Uncharacterized protein n=1 Tax=Acetobacter tropicalis TaxID=104102 RepID=A0A094YI11_9PROT|nr:hypothetical protein AtDm6_3342 [Acetobacter tropicalis]
MGYDFYTGGKRFFLESSTSSGEAYKIRTDKISKLFSQTKPIRKIK